MEHGPFLANDAGRFGGCDAVELSHLAVDAKANCVPIGRHRCSALQIVGYLAQKLLRAVGIDQSQLAAFQPTKWWLALFGENSPNSARRLRDPEFLNPISKCARVETQHLGRPARTCDDPIRLLKNCKDVVAFDSFEAGWVLARVISG